jgi:hypothetical protein
MKEIIDLANITFGRISLFVSDEYELLPPSFVYEFTLIYNQKEDKTYSYLMGRNGTKIVKKMSGSIFKKVLYQIKNIFNLPVNEFNNSYYGNPLDVEIVLKDKSVLRWNNYHDIGSNMVNSCHHLRIKETKLVKSLQEKYDMNTGLLISMMKMIFN